MGFWGKVVAMVTRRHHPEPSLRFWIDDGACGAMYLSLTDRPVFRTVIISDGLAIDVDSNDQPVGIEILTLPAKDWIQACEQFPSLHKLTPGWPPIRDY